MGAAMRCYAMPPCPATTTTTTTILILSHTLSSHSLTTAAAAVPAPTKHTAKARTHTHTHKPMMTSMTSPPSLARHETSDSNQLRCARGYHQSHTNFTNQTSPANRAARRHSGVGASVVFDFALFNPSTPFAGGHTVSQTTSSSPEKQASRPATIALQGYALSSCLPSAQLPDTITLALVKPNYITFLCRSEPRFRSA